jgi:virginiamycin B lyase
MSIGWRGFRRFGQVVAVAAAMVLLSAAGLPGGRGWHTAYPAGAPGIIPGLGSASGVGHVKIFPGISIPGGITAGPDGALWFTDNGNNSIGRITTTVTP